MKHPLLAALLTPMAAPETRRLKAMRLIWMALCAGLAAAVAGRHVLIALFGPAGIVVTALLCLAVPVHGLVYFRAKTRADDTFARGDEP